MSDIIRLRWNGSAKPLLVDRNGEAIVNWTGGGNHDITADATYAHTGTKSFKITVSGVGDLTTNCCDLPSANNATFVVGTDYIVTVWAYAPTSAQAFRFQVKTGGVTSSLFTCIATAWTAFHFKFTAVTATTDVQIAVIEDGGSHAIWFELEEFCEYSELPVLSEKGLSKAEKYSMYPPIVNEILDGSKETQYQAFIRSVNIRTNSLTDAQLLDYLYWTLDNDRLADYDILSVKEVALSLVAEPEQEVQRYDDNKLTPYLEVNFTEGVARTVWP